jgi:hypothetical protein
MVSCFGMVTIVYEGREYPGTVDDIVDASKLFENTIPGITQ